MELIIRMAVYVGEWHDGCKSLVRSSLVEVPRKWALDIDHQLKEAASRDLDEAAVSCLKAKECMCYMYGVLCFSGSAPLRATDVAVLCELHILAHKSRVLTGDEDQKGESSSLQVRCLGVMARRVGQIVLQAHLDSSFITAAVRLVLDHTPPQLSWAPVPNATACFHAEFRGHLFSVDLLTGVVLYDGAPPRFLPTDIVEDDQFRRVFGETNFEVATASDGVFTSTAAIGGRSYEFSRPAGNFFSRAEVVIEEVDNFTGERLQLLRHDGSWGKQLPVRLRTMHSHWLCRDQAAILVRPKGFRQRDVSFIVDCNHSDCRAIAYRVPPHLSSAGCRGILEVMAGNPDSIAHLVLLPADSQVMTVLAKFEPRATGPKAVIHAYYQPGGGLKIELPRFDLEFEVAPVSSEERDEYGVSGIHCLSHRGYQLARCQQLDDTLPGLTRYLVLRRKDGDVKVIVPRGRAVVVGDTVRRVWVECQDEESEEAELRIFCYPLHRRWKQPDAVDVSARLQLAEVFAATGSVLRDLRAGMVGHEKACELVRGCFVNHPLPEVDRDRVLRVLDLSSENAALVLLCGDLLESSTSLAFLHNEQSPVALPSEAITAVHHAKIVYQNECVALPWHRRRRLSVAEEVRVLGRRVPMMRERSLSLKVASLPHRPVSAKELQEAWQLENGVVVDEISERQPVAASDKGVDPCPLNVPKGADTLTRDMHMELRSSWEAHQRAAPDPLCSPLATIQRLHEEFCALHKKVLSMQERLGQYLLRALSAFGTSGQATAWHMRRVAGLLPMASLPDLPPMLWESERIREFNPFLTSEVSEEFEHNVLAWLRLCVLEDKLARLEEWTKTPQTQALMWQELQVNRFNFQFRHESLEAAFIAGLFLRCVGTTRALPSLTLLCGRILFAYESQKTALQSTFPAACGEVLPHAAEFRISIPSFFRNPVGLPVALRFLIEGQTAASFDFSARYSHGRGAA